MHYQSGQSDQFIFSSPEQCPEQKVGKYQLKPASENSQSQRHTIGYSTEV
jgi:hypothetical protein